MTSLELGHEQQPVQAAKRLVAGRYRLHARIGSGRLGDIYEAHDEGYRELGVGGRVAIQLLPNRIALDNGLFSKLKLGYTVLRAGAHPNIVPYLDCDHDGKFGYLVMQLLDGASLRFVLDDVATLPLDETLPVIRAVGDALQFLHAKSMVHGQLCAESVFITETLEVRLLDVVPLESASTILRGIASRDPFSRTDASDDVYALACLAYEMLAGKHPFNFHPPAEASAAGIRPARIASLPEQQWNAIRLGLSPEREKRPETIRAFLDELGITGTERLRRSETSPVDDRVEPKPVRNDAAPVRPAEAVVTGPVAHAGKRREIARTRRKRASRRRSLALLPVLAGLTVWYFYGQPGDDIANLTARISGSSESAAAVEGTAPAAVAADQETLAPDVTVTVDTAEAPRSPAVAEPVSDEMPAAAAPETDSGDEPQFDAGIEPASAAPGSTLIQSLVTVYERDGAARIAFRRPVGTTGTVVWWTADNTAIAESDYIPLEQPVIAFASGEEAETLHVPLVNDGLPEPRETFLVYLGQRDPASGVLEPIARIRVEINDDD
jgi:serine/threonine protein kinase